MYLKAKFSFFYFPFNFFVFLQPFSVVFSFLWELRSAALWLKTAFLPQISSKKAIFLHFLPSFRIISKNFDSFFMGFTRGCLVLLRHFLRRVLASPAAFHGAFLVLWGVCFVFSSHFSGKISLRYPFWFFFVFRYFFFLRTMSDH